MSNHDVIRIVISLLFSDGCSQVWLANRCAIPENNCIEFLIRNSKESPDLAE